MLLNKQRCKCLAALHTPYDKLKTYEPLKYDCIDHVGYVMQGLWDDANGVRDLAKKRMYTVSEPFAKLVKKNTKAMLNLASELHKYAKNGEFSGVYIEPQRDTMLVYSFDGILNEEQRAEEQRYRQSDDPWPMFHCKAFLFREGRLLVNGFARIHSIEGSTIKYTVTCNECPAGMGKTQAQFFLAVMEMLYLELFIRFAETEKVVVENGQSKDRKGKLLPVQNYSGLPVTYYDSRWVREIIRTEGFKVRGHFRLQPCKDSNGEWTKKLIYINEYQKNGYHLKAGKDKD